MYIYKNFCPTNVKLLTPALTSPVLNESTYGTTNVTIDKRMLKCSFEKNHVALVCLSKLYKSKYLHVVSLVTHATAIALLTVTYINIQNIE